jgi:hypothetical protein
MTRSEQPLPSASSRAVLGFALALLLPLAGCSFADDTLLPSLAGEDPRGRPRAVATGAPASVGGIVPAAATAVAAPAPVAGDLRRLRSDLQRLQGDVGRIDAELDQLRQAQAQSDAAYQGRLVAIDSQRRAGTPPSDPKLAADVDALQGQIAQRADLLSRLSALSTRATSEATFGSYLLQSIRATTARGDLSDGDRRQLQGIESDAVRAAALADRAVSAIAEQIAEGSRRLAAERREVAALAASGAPAASPAATAPRPPAGGAAAGERRPFVTIRFDRPDVAYEAALRDAVAQARQRRPDVAFDLVAVTPSEGGSPESAAAAKRNVESVFRSLLRMGVAADRIRLSAQTRPDATTPEVRLFVR